MKQLVVIFLLNVICSGMPVAQQKHSIIDNAGISFLENITKAVTDSSRIYPEQAVPPFGANKTGGILIRPGGRNTYPAF